MSNQLFAAALGISEPWYVRGVDFDAAQKSLTIDLDFTAGSRFAHPEAAGQHPVHDTEVKRYRHLNFFQHECFLQDEVLLKAAISFSVRSIPTAPPELAAGTDQPPSN